MTKIRNTKKGMAKKTLSISLAVAMLATSNVPVWAAEDLFTDGEVAVEAFTADETPVVEEVVEVPEAQVATGYTVETNMELKDGDWLTSLVFAKKDGVTDDAKFVITDNNTLTASANKVEIWSGDSLVKSVDVVNGDVADALAKTAGVGLDAYKNSKVVTIKVYVANENEAVYEDSAVVKPVDISTGCSVTTVSATKAYNGQIQSPDVIVTKNGYEADVVVKFVDEKEAKNVGEYEYSVEGVDENGYTGTCETGKFFTITPATPNKDNLSVVISGEATYNGVATQPTVVITDKYSNTVIPSELYTVTVNNNAIGNYNKNNVTITLLKQAKIGADTVANNFAAVEVQSLATGEFEVTALDLSKLDEKYDISVAAKTTGRNVTWADITFADKATGKVVDYKKILPYAELTILTSNNATVGTGKITIKPTNITNKNVIGEYTTSFAVVGNVITKDDLAFPAGTKIGTVTLNRKTTLANAQTYIDRVLGSVQYNGSAIEPLKEALSNIVLTASSTVADQKLVLGVDYDLTYAENTDSKAVSGKTSTITLDFKGDYAGKIQYTFDIAQANVYVKGLEVPYTIGKTLYEAAAKVETREGSTYTAVPESEYTVTTTVKADGVGKYAKGVVSFNNKNYVIVNGAENNGYYYIEFTSKVVAKKLSDCTAAIEGDYVYTGQTISPKLIVKDGETVLVEGKDYVIISKTGTNAGPAHVTIEGRGNYQGTLTVDYTIKKANMADAVVLNAEGKTNYDRPYSGTVLKPDVATVKIGTKVLTEYNPGTKEGDYVLTWDENAIEVGTYNFAITAVATSKNVEGEFKGTYKVTPNKLSGTFATKLGLDKVVKGEILSVDKTGAYYTGEAITLDSFKTKYVLLDNKTNSVLTEGKDYRLEYENNVNAGIATVTAYGLGNYAAVDANGKETPITSMQYYISAKAAITADWVKKISDVEYAGGLPVEPEVIIMDAKDNRLVQGRDFTVETKVTAIGNYTAKYVTIKGKGAYTTTDAANTVLDLSGKTFAWKVTKKDMKNTDVTVNGKEVSVMNGTVLVPTSEYDVVFSADGTKVTVTAKENSKYYTGSKEVATYGEEVGQAWINEVKVVGNKATVVLSDDVDNASGYDYVIATEEDYKNGRVDITKNQIRTTGDFYYVQKGVYYAYCHAWKRDSEGKKVFGEWSNLYQFTVGATTPSTPVITSVKVKGSTVTVNYTASKDALGYDVVLGSSVGIVNGERRPVNYGELVKKNIKGNTVTVTFKNVPAGTYYAGLHAFNRTSVDNKKVFSPWSNVKTVTVK